MVSKKDWKDIVGNRVVWKARKKVRKKEGIKDKEKKMIGRWASRNISKIQAIVPKKRCQFIL